ncbi:MAG: hypothetical protein MET45_15275 [Nostoc sp. LLA-1]|nr:hypothetical protein [Cyanocohniella sp. LLY]
MLIYFVRDKDISLDQHRGLETIDANVLFVLIRASVEQVSQAFSNLRQMNVWERNIYEREIDIHNESFLVFQLRGHPWSLIYKFNLPSNRIYLTEEDAQSISESLGTSAIFYAGSDTCGTMEYHLYHHGILQEKLSFEEEVSIEFQSQLRQIEAGDIKSAYRFTMDFIREQDAYIPCLIEVEDLKVGQRTKLHIEDLMPDEVERMDYLAQQ